MSSRPRSTVIGVDAPSSPRRQSDPKTNRAATTNGQMTATQADHRVHGRDNVDVMNKSRKHLPPPSAPLPPLPPSEAAATSVPRSTPGSPVQLSESHNSTRKSRNAELEQVPADAPQPPTLRARPTGAAPSRIALRHSKHDVGEDFDFGVKHKLASFSPYVPDARQLATPPESVPPPPPPKSGLLKRFRTRLAGTRSSPSLRPSESANEPSIKGGRALVHNSPPLPTHQEEEQREAVTVTRKPAGEATPLPVLPGRRASPVPVLAPDQKQKLATHQTALNDRRDQPLNGPNNRLSLAAFAGRRAVKREAKAREERRATEARRAAALARTGLLPASRRYSIVHLPDRDNGLDQFDPFAKDAALEGSGDGVVVDEPRSIVGSKEEEIEGPMEAGMSAAEIVIREWRERNARATRVNGASPSNGSASEMQNGNEPTKLERLPETPPIRSDSEGITLKSTQANDEVAGAKTRSNVSQERVMSPPAGTPLTPDPAVADSVSVSSQRPKRHQSPPAPSNVLYDSKTGSGGSNSKGKQVRGDKRPSIEKDASHAGKAGESEKAELASWRFPAVSLAASPEFSDPPRETEKGDVKRPSSPASPRSASSGSTAVANASKASTTSYPAQDIPPPPPPKPKKDVIKESDKGEDKTSSSGAQSQPSLAQKKQLVCRTTPPRVSTSPHPRPSPSIGPSVSPTRRTQTQKYLNGLATTSSQATAMGLSLPTLSPTTSTNTSTTSGSAFPRTPSTSSHGHSPVRVLDTPLENEEDALLAHNDDCEPQELRRTRQVTKVTGVKEFGQFAKLAELEQELEQDPDSEQSEFGAGALPPLPPSLSSNSSSSTPSFGNDVTPNTKDRDRLAEENERRKRTTLFGRRRTAPNGPPMISIPENHTGALVLAGKDKGSSGGKNQKQQQPRHASSFTNIRRTVTSVTAGFAGAAGIKPSSSRDRSPLRGATLPVAARSSASPAGGPQSNDYCNYDANLLSPNSASGPTLEQRQRAPGVGLRLRPLNPTMHSRGSILLETHAIEDAESRRLAELAFLD